MYLPPVGTIQGVESKGEPSTEGGNEIGNKAGEKKKVRPSPSPIKKVGSADPRAEQNNKADPYECMPKYLSFQWQPPSWSRVPGTLCR